MSDTDDVSVSVVLPAGGTGERFGSSMPKQFCPVMDRPIILYTLHEFHRLSCVKHIVVVVSQPYMDYMEELVESHGYSKIMVVRGAQTRHRSIYNGVKTLKSVLEPSDVVIIHDAVRLFIDASTIQEVAKASKETGAAGVHRPLISTVISSDGCGYLEESLDRNRYCASEMPQGFIFSVILSAYEKATDHDFDFGTECLHLALKYAGTKARLIEGPHNLWKVTLRKDLYAAEGMLKENELQVQVVGCCDRDLVTHLQQDFAARHLKMTVCDSMETCDLVDTNCTVYYYTQFDCDVITEYTENHHEEQKKDGIVARTPFMDKVIVHVIRSEDKVMDCCRKVREAMQGKTKSWRKKHLLVYFVLSETKASVAVVSEMVASVIWTRDPVMAGQTYMAFD
ncbi:isoprenoid synthase domain-containing protein-like [Mizuhopecten yessoensis]|uniref:2-C-methyl-D-erythritol 4-phosphate cytidylyltransferase, chloroplastic n=1 Tax=Mizuhopecten yessoensis TaxID=6573 RepID=A0A210QMI0_MIZYE|nr:isoprenoid synthase domain-containing protein-like [Mizuhopecten yessoensis]OWF49934.1 Isoprenoid synthase domain-containing protein [Mizuhopecten yessoensis]